MGDFDVEAVHLVVFHFQAGNAGALAFARFQVEQEGAGVLGERAQFVEFGIEVVGDDAAFAQHGSRLGSDGAGEQAVQFRQRGAGLPD